MAIYMIHSTVRGRQTRTQRAAQPQHNRLKQFVGDKQQRLMRGRPLRFTEEEFQRSLVDIKEKAAAGILEVRNEVGQLINLETLQPIAPVAPPAPSPNPPLDSIANDQPWGQHVPPFAGDTAPVGGGEPDLLTRLESRDEEEPAIEVPSFETGATDPAPNPDVEGPEIVSNRPAKGSKKGKR